MGQLYRITSNIDGDMEYMECTQCEQFSKGSSLPLGESFIFDPENDESSMESAAPGPELTKDSVMVYGGEKVQPYAMGVFTVLPEGAEMKLGVPRSGRCTYGNEHGKLLYFHQGYGWLIDDVGCQKDSKGYLFSHSEVQCPSLASDWYMWHGD